jgi:hypothetical protein
MCQYLQQRLLCRAAELLLAAMQAWKGLTWLVCTGSDLHSSSSSPAAGLFSAPLLLQASEVKHASTSSSCYQAAAAAVGYQQQLHQQELEAAAFGVLRWGWGLTAAPACLHSLQRASPCS